MRVSGKLLIILIFGTALVGGVATLWVQFDARRRSREFWGADNAVLINRAPKVELLRLTKASEPRDDGSQVTIDNVTFEISERKDVSKTRGFVHVRDALIRDAGFEWDKARGDCVPQWDFALDFEKGDQKAIVAIDLNCERVQLVAGGQEASIGPTMSGIKNWLDAEFPEMMKNKKREEELPDS